MAIVLVVLVLLLVLMVLGWRARQRRQASIATPDAPPASMGAVHGQFEGLYVASTVANEPLNRIAVRGLGFRSRAEITVADAGIVLALRGEAEAFIPVASLREVTRATWTIDRVVEAGGLVLVAWTLGSGESAVGVDSYFRLVASHELLDAINEIYPVSTGRKA
jgi:hypothetical protein